VANLNTQSFGSIVSNFATAVQGSASTLIDFSVGSILLAIGEAMGGVALWLQGLILQVAALTRAATSSGTDLDSWLAQFGFAREAAVAAITQETFSRYTPTNSALIPVGANVTSSDGTVTFTTIADTTNTAYSASQGGYVLPAGQASVNATVQCTVAGTIGNVAAGALNTLGTAISGIDYVSNGANVQNGIAAETDPAVRARFILWVAGLGGATLIAVQAAIAGVQQNMSGIIVENTQYNGQTQYGYFTVIANDGSGNLTSTEETSVSNAIENVRPLTVTYGVHGPLQQAVTVSMDITVASGYTESDVAPEVQAALIAYINGIETTEEGATLPYTSLSNPAYATPGVTNVTNMLLNGGTADLTITYAYVFAATTGSVTVN
jgi:uncharacterized phage protein gp47/JayE